NGCTTGNPRADAKQGGVEASRLHGLRDVRDLAVVLQLDPQIEDAPDLGIEHLARQPIFGNAEAHHSPREWTGLDDLDAMTKASEVIGRGQARWPGAHNEYPLAAFGSGRRKLPPTLQRFRAEEALH